MFCSQCGTQIDDNSVFCLKCGIRIHKNLTNHNNPIEKDDENIITSNLENKKISVDENVNILYPLNNEKDQKNNDVSEKPIKLIIFSWIAFILTIFNSFFGIAFSIIVSITIIICSILLIKNKNKSAKTHGIIILIIWIVTFIIGFIRGYIYTYTTGLLPY